MLKKIIMMIISLCVIFLISSCSKITNIAVENDINLDSEITEENLNIKTSLTNSALNEYHNRYYNIISQSFAKCNDYDKLNKINFDPCNEMEKALYNADYDLKNLKKFQFNMVNILDTKNRDITMKVTVVEGEDKVNIELLMVFIYNNNKYYLAGSIFADSYINNYELVDIDDNNSYEVVIDYNTFNGKRWLEVYKCHKTSEWECIFKDMNANLIYVEKYPYKFLDGPPKDLIVKKEKYYYSSLTKKHINKIIEYKYHYNGKIYEPSSQIILAKEKIIDVAIDDENAPSYYQLIQESYTNCKDYKWLDDLNFSPSKDIENEIKNHYGKIRKLYDFKFEKCNIWGKNSSDIIMRVKIESEIDSFELLMVFINKDDKYHLVGTLEAATNSIEYELIDLNNDDKPEMISNYILNINGNLGLLEIYQFNNPQGWECIFENGSVDLNLFELNYEFSDENTKELIINESRMYYNTNDQQKKAETIQYIFHYNGEQFELDESKKIWKANMEDFKTYVIG
jgi:hypothetical protein